MYLKTFEFPVPLEHYLVSKWYLNAHVEHKHTVFCVCLSKSCACVVSHSISNELDAWYKYVYSVVIVGTYSVKWYAWSGKWQIWISHFGSKLPLHINQVHFYFQLHWKKKEEEFFCSHLFKIQIMLKSTVGFFFPLSLLEKKIKKRDNYIYIYIITKSSTSLQ